tara:strand:+ start:1169 stop:2140 length:972 start_codon:yes stop_codon:yes gene_type:complete
LGAFLNSGCNSKSNLNADSGLEIKDLGQLESIITNLNENDLSDHLVARMACERVGKIYSSCGDEIELRSSNKRDFLVIKNPIKKHALAIPCYNENPLSFYERMNSSDLDIFSIFYIYYQFGKNQLPEKRQNYDPGRLRIQELNKYLYGSSASEVQKNLVTIDFLNQKIKFQKKFSGARMLELVGAELIKLSSTDKESRQFLTPFLSGQKQLNGMTFNWRNIAGSHRLSTHSFGTAIDLLTDHPAQYWLWDEIKRNPDQAKKGESAYEHDHFVPSQRPYIPLKIIRIFEKHGFIWGGKWNHYDTMHFEYRPEFNTKEISQVSCY